MAICIALALPATAAAQAVEPAAFELDRFRPGMDLEAIAGVETGALPLHLVYDVNLWLGYSHNLMMLRRGGTRVGALVGPRIGAHLGGAISLFDWVQVGIGVPIVFFQNRNGIDPADVSVGSVSVGGLGDLRLSPKIRVLRADQAFIDVAFIPVLTLHSNVPRRAYLGERNVSFAPTVAVSKTIAGVRLAANLTYHWRESRNFLGTPIGQELRFGAGVAIDAERWLNQPVEVATSLRAAMALDAPAAGARSIPMMEWMFEGAFRATDALTVFAGGAFGLVAGIGTPDFRFFAGVRWAPRPKDSDGDRIPDIRDKCVDEPEDMDGFEDSDGCPDPDNDGDGIEDIRDQCPNDPETFDGIQDEDGCPEEGRATVRADRIEIGDAILFETNKAILKKQSYPLLDEAAVLLIKNPQLGKVRIEGHTDSIGPDEGNLILSQDRADAVRRYLIKKGVKAKRLEAKGFGETRPLGSNDTEAGRAKNRRVEFIVIRAGGG